MRSDEEAAGDREAVTTSDRCSVCWYCVMCEMWGIWCSGGVETAVVEVLRVLGKEAAAQAVTQLIQTYCCLADVAQSQGNCCLCLECERCNR